MEQSLVGLFSASTSNGSAEGRMLQEDRVQEVLARLDRKSTRLNSSHIQKSRMPSSA